MRTIAIVFKIDSRRALHFQNCRPNELQKSDERRNRISGKSKDETAAEFPEQEWLAGFDRAAPDVDFRSELAQRRLNEIVLTDGNTAGHDHKLVLARALKRLSQFARFIAT